MNKILPLIVVFAALLVILMPSCAMSEKIENTQGELQVQKPFRIKDYKDTKKAEEALKKLYPAGSDADKMIEDMKQDGAKCVGIGGRIFRGHREVISINKIVCEHSKKEFGLMYEWDWAVHIFMTKDRKIESIAIDREYFGV